MKQSASFLMCLLLVGCATTSQVERDLDKKVPFVLSQVLLRDAIACLNQDIQTEIVIDPKLNEIANLCMNHFPRREKDAWIPIGVALDMLRMQTIYKYGVPVDWKIEDDHILFFYAGSDQQYAKEKKRDAQPAR
jgi:hypothetical protein